MLDPPAPRDVGDEAGLAELSHRWRGGILVVLRRAEAPDQDRGRCLLPPVVCGKKITHPRAWCEGKSHRDGAKVREPSAMTAAVVSMVIHQGQRRGLGRGRNALDMMNNLDQEMAPDSRAVQFETGGVDHAGSYMLHATYYMLLPLQCGAFQIVRGRWL